MSEYGEEAETEAEAGVEEITINQLANFGDFDEWYRYIDDKVSPKYFSLTVICNTLQGVKLQVYIEGGNIHEILIPSIKCEIDKIIDDNKSGIDWGGGEK